MGELVLEVVFMPFSLIAPQRWIDSSSKLPPGIIARNS